jgi:beta propeller repeat protein
VRVENVGHWAAEGFTVNLYYDGLHDTLLVDATTVEHLSARKDTVLRFQWLMPGGEPTRLMHVEIDTGQDITEMSELNNLAMKRFYLSVADLIARIKHVDPFPVVIGDSVTVYAMVENSGEDVARDFNLSFFDSTTDEGRQFAVYPIDSLSPGEHMEMTARFSIREFAEDYAGVWVVADPQDRVLEYYLSNNAHLFKVNSGAAGAVLVAPFDRDVSALRLSRSCLALESPECRCLLLSTPGEPFDVIFEVPGRDLDLSRSSAVFSAMGDIVGYDLRDSVMFVVSTQPEREIQPVIWGDNVAWVTESLEASAIHLKRGSAAAEVVRLVSDSWISNLDISHRLLVWEEEYEEGPRIFAFDLEADSLISLGAEEQDRLNPCVWGNTAVWEARSSDGGDIVGYDVASGRRLSIAEKPGSQWHPAISGDIVMWQDFRNGNWDIYAYSLTSGQEFPVSRQTGDQILPALSDSTVFWVDRRGPRDEVRGLRLGGSRRVVSVERFEALSQDGQIKLMLSVDEHEDGIKYRLYRYPDDRPMSGDRHTHLRSEFELRADSTYVYADTLVAARRPFYYTLGVIDGYGEETFYGPVDGRAYREASKRLLLGIPVPNPCRQGATVTFGVPRTSTQRAQDSWPDPMDDASDVRVVVYSVTGRAVRTIHNGSLVPGYYTVFWDGTNDSGRRVSPGVYVVNAAAGGSTASQKVILLE